MPQGSVDDFRPETADESLAELTAELTPRGVAVEGFIEYGGVATVLLDACERADLLVVGTRGLGGFSRLLLGSNSQQCATHARVPVAVVPGGTDDDAAIEQIVVGMDGSAGARAALAWALDFATPDTGIRVVSAWSGGFGNDLEDRPVETQALLAEVHATVDEVEQARAMSGRTAENSSKDMRPMSCSTPARPLTCSWSANVADAGSLRRSSVRSPPSCCTGPIGQWSSCRPATDRRTQCAWSPVARPRAT